MILKRLALLAIIAIVIVGLSGTTPPVYGADEKLAPQVIDTSPVRGEELPVDGGITLYFDQAMNRSSVESAFKADPKVTGTFTWVDDSTVAFKSSSPFSRNTEYTFSVSNSAVSAAGVPLRDTFILKLRTAGALEVSQILPANGTVDVEAMPTVTVIFNRPVVPLLTVEEMAKLPSPITITPAADGKGEWLNTSIYTFKPTKPLAGSTKYIVTVNKGLTDITGSVLENSVSASFVTLSPRVIEFSPSDNNTNELRDPTITVTFSQPMDTVSTESAFSLKSGGPKAKPVEGTFTWDENHYKLTFKPSTLLDYGQLYEVRIDTEKARSETGGKLDGTAVTSFTTINQPDIVSTQPQDNNLVYPYGGFTVYFSSPINFKDFKSRIIVDPKPTLFYDDSSDEAGFAYSYNFGTEPSTDYTITIDVNGLTDKYGTPITLNPNSYVYKIVAPGKAQVAFSTQGYDPEVSLKTGSYIGLYSAYRAQTRVFSTHRNIGKLDLSLYSVSLDDFLKLASSNNYDFQSKFEPQDFLRRWTVPVENPGNTLRYDLLTISDQGPSIGQTQNITCLGAPPAQVKVGDNVVVLRDVNTPQRIRKEAGLLGEILGQAKPGTEFTVVSGPICADQYLWWQVKSADGSLTGWTAEGDASHYFIGPKNTSPSAEGTAVVENGTNPDAKSLKAGVYYLELSSPDLSQGNNPLTHIMVVGTANITLKVAAREALAWVTDLQSGQPVPQAEVSFIAGKTGITLGKAKTDENGIARFTLPEPLGNLYTEIFAVVNDGKNFGVGLSEWTDGLDPWYFNLDSAYTINDVNVYLYTERALYRPGQPVYFRGVLRSQDDVTYSLNSAKTISVEVRDNQTKVIYQKDVAVTPFGTFSDSFDLDPNAPLGYYQIIARPTVATDETDDRVREFSHGFSVAEYRLPEFKVAVNSEKADVLQGDTIKVTVDSSFFFGGAVSNANVDWSVRSNDYYFTYKGTGYYNFTDYNEDAGASENDNPNGSVIADGKGKTDAQGKFIIELPADLGKVGRSQTFTIEASVTDESNQQVSGRVDVTVHQGEFYIGVSPENYVGTAKTAQKINLLTANWDSAPVANTSLSVKVVERLWSSVQTVEPGTGRTVWNYDVKENPVTDGVVQTDAQGKAVFEFTPTKSGIYKVYATSRDSKGNQITSSAFLWVAGEEYVPWRQENSNRIEVKIDHDSYKVGDTASLLIASPFQGEATALITVERGKVLKTETVKMNNNSYVYKLPITPDMAPNVYVSVMIVKGVDKDNPVAGFRMGLVQLGVETNRLNLNIEITPDKPQAGPREQVTYKLHVTDYAGKPVQAEVGVALVDEAALSLLEDQSPPILQYFYGQRGLSVRTSSTLTISVDQQTQEIINTVKGGGGGGPEAGIFEVRQEFVTTPLWNPTVQTDANGDANVTVTLPDNLTTWRLDARAVTAPTGELNTTLVGQKTFDLLSTKPLLIRPVTPRFYVVGDNSALAAVVNNNTDQDQDVEVRIDATGVKVSGDVTQKAKIPSKGRLRFSWPIEVLDVNAVGVTFFASTADQKYTDAAKSAVGQGDDKTLPVLRYEVPETVGTAGSITSEGGTQTEGISLPRREKVTEGTLAIRIDPSLAASTVDALDVLKNYPYQCLEQTVSRFLPNLMTYRAFAELGINNDKMKAELTTLINYAVQRLYAEQHVDGGWGWFVRDPSDTLITAYAIIGLSEAKSQGFTVEQKVIDDAIAFVQKDIVQLKPQSDTWVLNRQAFLIYALARGGKNNYSSAVQLFKIREKMSIYARAYLAMAFHIMNAKDTSYTDALVSDLQNRAFASATGMHWEEDYDDYYNWNTDTRTTAVVLNTLVELQPTNALIPNVVRWLMIARTGDSWETTQETAWSVMALTSWMKYTGELKPNYSYSVAVNDKSLASDKQVNADNVRETLKLTVDVKDLLTDQINKLVISRTGGDGILYYTAHLTAYLPVEQIKALSRGITLTRSYSLELDKDRKPITQAKVGDVIRVTLTIVAPNDLNYVVINDPIPAGTEAINPDLDTSSAVGQQPELRLDDPLSRGWGWWWFSNTELRDDRTVLYASYLPKGTYQFTYSIRAGLEGQYKVIPSNGQEFYFPEVYGRTDGSLFTILPADQQ